MQVKAGIGKVTDKNTDIGIEVKVEFFFLLKTDQEKGTRIELLDMMNKNVRITIEPVQTAFTYDGQGNVLKVDPESRRFVEPIFNQDQTSEENQPPVEGS
jgi:hypothetical protein